MGSNATHCCMENIMDCFDQLRQIRSDIDDKCAMLLEIVESFNNVELGWPLDYISDNVVMELNKYMDVQGYSANAPKIPKLQFIIQNLDDDNEKEGHPIIINGLDYQLVMDAENCDEAFQKLHGHLLSVIKKISNEQSTHKRRAIYLNALDLDLEVFRNVQNILMLKMEYRGKDLKAMPVHEKVELLKLAGAEGI